MSKRRIILWIISGVVLLSAASCASGGNNPAQDGTGHDTGYSDGLPDTDLKGESIVFMTREGFDDEIVIDEGIEGNITDVIDTAVYNRQKYIEERFKCRIEKLVEPQNPSGFYNEVVKSVNSDDGAFDVAVGHIDYVAALAPNGYLGTWQEMPYVDLEKSCWNQSANSSLTVGGNCFFALGDINYWLILQCNCIYFNKGYIEDYGLEDPYQTVLDGRWTLDYLSSLTKSYYTDVNNDFRRDIDDFYAFTVDVHSGLNSYQNATENLTYKKNSEDIPEFKAATKRFSTLVEKMYGILYNNESTFAAYDYSYQAEGETVYWWGVGSYKYNNGTTIFTHGWLGNATDVYRNTQYEYGIIPLPKYDEAQKSYHTMMDASGPFMCIPRTLVGERASNTGLIVQAMASYAEKYITPAVFEVALKAKYSTLEGSGKMLDLIVDGLTFDFGYVHSSDYHNLLRKVLVSKQSSLSVYLGKAMSSITSYYDEIIEAYLDYVPV
ncbi:MAG: hypothetical protein IKS28_04655 [Clostridia bacterium]|nr:hypothetical protein [Clostridia bacterium]